MSEIETRALHFPPGDWSSLYHRPLETLRADQRQALAELVGFKKTSGQFSGDSQYFDVNTHQRWYKMVDRAMERRVEELRKAMPKSHAEYVRLFKLAYPNQPLSYR